MFTVQRYHDISCGHRVTGHEGKCSHLHGHNYRITFTCQMQSTDPLAQVDHLGRVIDFGVIKKKLCDWLEEHWDHKFLLWVRDEFQENLVAIDPDGVYLVSFNPTAENMAQHLVETVGPAQLKDTGVTLIEAKVEETRKCSATFRREKL